MQWLRQWVALAADSGGKCHEHRAVRWPTSRSARPDGLVSGWITRPDILARRTRRPGRMPEYRPASERNGERPGGEQGGERPGGEQESWEASGYRPREEAEQAGNVTAEVLGEAREGVNEVRREHAAEVDQTPTLADAINRLAIAVDALSRTVTALRKEGRGGGSLVSVAVIQQPAADGAAEEAISVALPGNAVQKILQGV